MQSIASDRIQVSEAAAFEPDERAVRNMFEKLALNVTITEPGYIYAWVSNGSENTKVWFDDFRISHEANFVTQATDYEAWGDVLREQTTDESEYRYSYQGKFAEKDLETGWNHFELREYDPVIGRWLVPDPMGQHWSPYMAMGNDPVNNVDPDGGEDGPGDECEECAGMGAMLPSVEITGEFTGSIGGSLEGLHLAGLTGTGYNSYDDAGNWYQTINRMQGNITYMYSNNEWSLYRDDARLNDARLANVVSAADAIGKGTEFAISSAIGGFGGLLENTSLRAVGTAAKGGSSWVYGAFKTQAKWANQFAKRGWTAEQVTEAIMKGEKFNAVNMVNKANSATRYVHPTTGRSVVIDNVTKELLQVGGDGFLW
jgi:RHS repeat-associated protein